MSDRENPGPTAESPFYCLAVPIAPEEGAARAAFVRLQDLVERSLWLVRLRWPAVAGLFLATMVARFVLDLPVPTGALYFSAVCIAAYNALFLAVSRKRADAGADTEAQLRRADVLATAQIVADMAALTVLLHFSGGIENPLLVYFVFHVIVAPILFSRRRAFQIATFAVLIFGGLAAIEYTGLIAHYHIWAGESELYRSGAYVFTVLAVFASTMYLAVYISGDIVAKLRARDRELMSVTTSLERGTLELQDAYQRIKALEEKKSDVLRVAAHQLRSPVSAIKSLLDVVVHGYAKDDQERLRLLTRAHARTDGMLVMINELLVLSRLKDMDHILEESGEKVDVCSALGDLGALYGPRAREKGVRLEVSPPPETCVITAAGADVREALNNLVDNAINYTPSGGSVSCRAAMDGDDLVITVSDTGMGIEPSEIENVFEEFYRAPNAKAVDAHGTGLGLPIVKRSVEKWNGTISVDSRPGEGTTFTLKFPLAL